MTFEHLCSRSLLLQRLAQIVRALPQLVEQPRVLDGNDSLGSEVLDQLDLLVGERTHFLAVNGDRANQLAVLEHGNAERCPITAKLDRGNHIGIAFEIGRDRRDVDNVDHLLRGGETPEHRVRGRP